MLTALQTLTGASSLPSLVLPVTCIESDWLVDLCIVLTQYPFLLASIHYLIYAVKSLCHNTCKLRLPCNIFLAVFITHCA